MKKLGILLAALVTVTLVLSAIGCGGGGGGGGEATATPTHTVAPTKTPAQTTPAGTGDAGTLSEILRKALDIKSVYAEVVDTQPNQSPVTTKIWSKMSQTSYKMRMEAVTDASLAGEIGGETVAVGETVVTLYDFGTGTSYIYYPAHNMAWDMSWPIETPGPGETPTPTLEPYQESPWDMSSWLESYNPTIVRSEKYDGKDCLVVQYTTGGENTTEWIWKKYGIPIKTETTGPQGTSTIEYTNISFSDIPDSKFKLPAGVEKISMWGDMGEWQ